MKEHDFIKIIKEQLQDEYIGNDCAYLKDLGIVVSQDNFIEDVHFKTEWATPFQIGYKAAAVNISDILASGARPAYLSIGLSLPKYINDDFIKEFYKGITAGAYGAKIIGGDITGADKIFVSITAIGKTENRKISSRKNAKIGHVVIISSEHGKSALGLKQLYEGKKNTNEIKSHLEPDLDQAFSYDIATQIDSEYAMMDTSDGLADALYQIAEASGVKIVVKEVDGIYGTEDYKLVATVPKNFLSNISNYIMIGDVCEYDGVYLEIGNKKIMKHSDIDIYDHFKL